MYEYLADSNQIQRGKEQLRKLQNAVEEAAATVAATRKETETLTTKNGQLTREIFLLRHVVNTEYLISRKRVRNRRYQQ